MLSVFEYGKTGFEEDKEIKDKTNEIEIKSGEVVCSSPESNESEIKEGYELSAQEISESVYDQTIENVTAEFGKMMSEEQRVRIDIESENYRPEVMTEKDYFERFPEADPAVLGHYDSEGRVFLKDGDPETISHVTTHEAMHLSSYKETDDTKADHEVYRSGIHEVVYDEDGLSEDNNRALNEGITEIYTLRELEKRGETEAVSAVTAYPEAQQKADELQRIVGDETIQKAYFGGDRELLESEVNRLSYGDETAWKRYSKNVDILEYGTDEEEITKARWELTIQNAVMLSCKEYNKQAEKESA